LKTLTDDSVSYQERVSWLLCMCTAKQNSVLHKSHVRKRIPSY